MSLQILQDEIANERMIKIHENLEEMPDNWEILDSILLSYFKENYWSSDMTGKIIVSGCSLYMIKIGDGKTQSGWNMDFGMCSGQNIYYFVHTDMINMEHDFNDCNPG